jgi:glycosyltransferase involved in cell wall biosynthesis
MTGVTSLDVVICTFNRAERLSRVLNSLEQAHLPAGVCVEIIVVDNNSNDHTRELVARFAAVSKFRLRYLFEPQQGKSHALNMALRNVTSELVAFTDDDVIVDNAYFMGMVDAANRYPQCRCFGGKVVALFPDKMPKWLDIGNTMAFLRSPFVDRQDGDIEVPYGHGTEYPTPGGCNMFFRRSAIEENGPFRTDLGPTGRRLGFAEDSEYCARLKDRGEQFMYIPSVVVKHPVYPERLTKTYLLSWQYNCGQSEARRYAGRTSSVQLFGVPRYLFRRALTHFAGWMMSLGARPRFYHRLRLAYTLGEIVGHSRSRH